MHSKMCIARDHLLYNERHNKQQQQPQRQQQQQLHHDQYNAQNNWLQLVGKVSALHCFFF